MKRSGQRGETASSFQEAFTLVEMMFVLTIVLMLAALLLPSIRQAKITAWGATCMSNLRQISLGLSTYSIDNKEYMPPVTTRISTGVGPTWQQLVWKYVESRPYAQMDTTTVEYKKSVWSCPHMTNLLEYDGSVDDESYPEDNIRSHYSLCPLVGDGLNSGTTPTSVMDTNTWISYKASEDEAGFGPYKISEIISPSGTALISDTGFYWDEEAVLKSGKKKGGKGKHIFHHHSTKPKPSKGKAGAGGKIKTPGAAFTVVEYLVHRGGVNVAYWDGHVARDSAFINTNMFYNK